MTPSESPMTKQQAQAKLDALLDEEKSLRASILSLEEELKTKHERLKALYRGWHTNGEIEDARLAVRDAAFPVLTGCNNGWGTLIRIIAVSDKTITLREDGREEDDIKKYSRVTGMPPNSKYGQKIDVEKALHIWADHLAKTQLQPT